MKVVKLFSKVFSKLAVLTGLLGSLMAAGEAGAVPVVNENRADSGVITIYPDHADPNRFYIAPNIVLIARENDVPMFSYHEVRADVPIFWPFSKPVAVLQMLLVPTYTRPELEAAKAKILAANPNAQFSGLPFVSSDLAMSGETPLLIKENQCSHGAGLVEQQQSCSMILTERGRSVFRRAMNNRSLFTTFQFTYQFSGFARLPDNTFREQLITHGLAARIDGDQLAKFPQLFSRR